MFGAAANGGATDIVFDGEVPRSFTGRARTVISGGQFVVTSGAGNCIGSDIALYSAGSIVIGLLVGQDYANGIALHNAGSNEWLGVATRGTYITASAGSFPGGANVIPISGTVQGVGEFPVGISYSGTCIGRAITASSSGTNLYSLVSFSF